jgi:hypothetical protein
MSTPGMMTGEVLTGGIFDPGSTGGGSSGVADVTLRAKLFITRVIFALLRGAERLVIARGAGTPKAVPSAE